VTDAADVSFRACGRLDSLAAGDLAALVDRTPPAAEGVRETVAGLIHEVRERGDAALLGMAARFDGVALESIEVPRARWDEALATLDVDTRAALERAARNIRRFHEAQLPADVTVETEPGISVTRAWTPLARVGVYAPGGTAAYPSSVLMGVVPARAAGVDEVCVCSPPSASGEPPDLVLAACAIAGADRVFSLGGAGAIAAMAWGTETVPQVDAIVGPGNRWVTEAKSQLAGSVVIDAPAGPSEVLVLADGSGDPSMAALEMLAQAEHDPDASCVLVTTSVSVADATAREIEKLLDRAPRAEIAREAFQRRGGVIIVDSLDDAIDFANLYAPEHMSILAFDATALSRRVRNAGTIFIGAFSSVAFGDYMTGANHVLPTAGRARSFSGLGSHTFLRSFTIQDITPAAARAMAPDVERLANAEGLPAHAEAAAARGDE